MTRLFKSFVFLRAVQIAVLLSCAAAAFAGELDRVRPEKAGMSSDRLERLAALNRQYVSEGKLAGVMTMVARYGKVVHVSAAGAYGVDNDKPLSEETLFRIYSMTKPVTAVAAMILYEQGAFHLNDPVAKFLPQFSHMTVWADDGAVDATMPITMHHLLTHTSGLSYGATDHPVDVMYREANLLAARDLEEFIDRLAPIPLVTEPGERWNYGVSYDVLGAVVEKISGQTFADFLQARIFEPLEMDDTFFRVPEDRLHRLATNHAWDDEKGTLVPLDSSAPLNRSFTQELFFAGGHGLVSTIGDYMRFCEMLRNGGSLGRVRLLSPKTIEYMTRSHLSATSRVSTSSEAATGTLIAALPGTDFGLGFGIVDDPAKAGVLSSRGSYFWGGHAGTIFWIDPQEDLVGIAMLQVMPARWPFRQDMTVLTYQAIERLKGPQP